MSNEIDTIDSDAVGQYYTAPSLSAVEEETPYHRAIFSHEKCPWPFMKKAVLSSNPASTEIKTQRIASRKIGGSGSADVTISWGGKDGVTVSGGASGEIHDSNGNYAKGEVRQDSHGEGSATVSGGHKK